jgi:hypothetical protein
MGQRVRIGIGIGIGQSVSDHIPYPWVVVVDGFGEVKNGIPSRGDGAIKDEFVGGAGLWAGQKP